MNLIQYPQALIVLNSMEFAVPLQVVPVSLTTLVALGWRCYREGRLLQALPLLATQLNSAFIWACLAANQIGYLNHSINGTRIIQKDSYSSLRNILINGFLLRLIYLEPLNLFLYTWRFLSELEQSVSKPAAKSFFKWFARISILLIPPAFISIVSAWIVEYETYKYYLYHAKQEQASHY